MKNIIIIIKKTIMFGQLIFLASICSIFGAHTSNQNVEQYNTKTPNAIEILQQSYQNLNTKLKEIGNKLNQSIIGASNNINNEINHRKLDDSASISTNSKNFKESVESRSNSTNNINVSEVDNSYNNEYSEASDSSVSNSTNNENSKESVDSRSNSTNIM